MRIGPYVVDPLVRKEGGQAFVYFSRDPLTGEHVAIKVARPTKWSQTRMEREIKTQQSLVHPNVLPVLTHDPAYRWYATARADASLDDIGPFPEGQWTRLRVGLMAVASAVDHAHSRRCVHRDLSPGNVLVFRHGWAVSDWGFVYTPPVRGRPRMTEPLERFGTPEFSAPEVLADPKNVGPAADVYSIGRLAAWGTGLKRDEVLATDTSVHSWWRRLIDGATAWDPNHRWALRDVEAHLRAKPSVVPAVLRGLPPAAPSPALSSVTRLDDYRRTEDRCPHCHASAGRDAAERCLGCHAMLVY